MRMPTSQTDITPAFHGLLECVLIGLACVVYVLFQATVFTPHLQGQNCIQTSVFDLKLKQFEGHEEEQYAAFEQIV